MFKHITGGGLPPHRRWLGYALAVVGAAAAFSLTEFWPQLFGRMPFAAFLVISGILTLWAGSGPGLVLVGLSVFATTLLLHPPVAPLGAVGFLAIALPTIVFIHRQQGAMRALRESEQRYQRLSELSEDIVVYDDLDGHIESVNTAGPKISGHPLSRFLSGRIEDFVVPEHLSRVQEARTRLLAEDGPKTLSSEIELQAADGHVVTLDVRTGLRVVDGRPIGFQSVARDVTEGRRLEARLHQSQKMEAIGRLAGGIAHDFNNMLTAIVGYTDLALRGLGHTHPHAGDLRQVLVVCERAADMICQLLAFSRQQALKPVVLDPNEAVRNIESLLRRLIGADVRLVTRFAEDVGAVKVDPTQLVLVLMNLAVNARDAMPSGGTLTIDTATTQVVGGHTRHGAHVEPGRYVAIGVTDTGLGMDAATQAHIFEPFFSTKPEGEGTGLGLATVYGIVKQSGGFVWVSSEPGRGTRFEVLLPCVDAPIDEPLRHQTDPEVLTGTETILLAEDDDALRGLATETLTELGYTVLSASDGAEAFALAKRHQGHIDLVLADVVMPGMSGPELVARLRRAVPSLTVLYMSGFVAPAGGQPGAFSLDAPLIRKPFTPTSLAHEVRKVLDQAVSGRGTKSH